MIPEPSNLPIRYAAAGPVIGNTDGGEAVPGEGFTLRVNDNFASTGVLGFDGTIKPIPTPLGDFTCQLSNPKPNLRYSAEIFCPIANQGAAPAAIRFLAQWKVDAGGFVNNPSDEWLTYDLIQAANTSFGAFYRTSLKLGSALSAPVLDASTLLTVRFAGTADSGVGSVVGNQMFARLIETL